MCDVTVIDDALSELTRLVGTLGEGVDLNSITHQLKVIKRSTENLRSEVYKDSKFDVLNHKSYEVELRKRVESGDSFYLGMIDLDNLKKINDKYGHFLADKVISKVIAILQIEFGNENVFRVGGDEFIVLMDSDGDLSKFDASRTQVGKSFVRDRRREFPEVSGFSISSGVAFYDSSKDDAGNVAALADEMLYKAKVKKNSVVYSNQH